MLRYTHVITKNSSSSTRYKKPSKELLHLMINHLIGKTRQPIMVCRSLLPSLCLELGMVLVVAVLVPAGFVRHHDVCCYARIKANKHQPHISDPLIHVVIFCSPPIEFIAESIYLLEVGSLHGYGPTKESAVWKVIPEGVQSRVHVSGVVRAAVSVEVIQRKEVNIMEDEAVIMVQLEGLHKTNVEQLGSIESCSGCLFHNHNPIVQLLPGEEGMHMRQELLKISASVAERNYDCYPIPGLALLRFR